MPPIPTLIITFLLTACIVLLTVKLISRMIRTAAGGPEVKPEPLKGELDEHEWQSLHRIADAKRVMSRERRQALLNEALQVDETDLVLNRSGALSDKQKRSAVLLKVIVFLAIVGMGAVILNVVFSSIVSVVFRMPGFFERHWREREPSLCWSLESWRLFAWDVARASSSTARKGRLCVDGSCSLGMRSRIGFLSR